MSSARSSWVRGGKLTPPSAEATGRQRPDLLAQGDGIHVETSIGSVQEDLAGVEPPSRPIGSTWDDQEHGTRRIDRIAADDHHWPDPGLFRAFRGVEAGIVDLAPSHGAVPSASWRASQSA